MRQETDRAILANAKAIQVVETKLEGIEQMLHEQSLMLHKLSSESSVGERTPTLANP